MIPLQGSDYGRKENSKEMAVNPFELMKLKERLSIFEQQHSRFGLFMKDVGENAVRVGSVVEMKVTDPSGKQYITNIRLTEEDIETLGRLRGMKHHE